MTIPVTPSKIAKNIFFWAMPLAWGHNKPIAAFGVRILEARPDVLITVFTISSIYPKLLAEIDRISGQAKVPKEDIMRRFYVIDILKEPLSFEKILEPLPAFSPAFEALWNEEPIKCLSTGKVYSDLPRPTVAVIDPFQGYAIEIVRETTLPLGRIPIFAWLTTNAGASLQIFGPKRLGAAGPSGRLNMNVVRNGITVEEIQKLGAFNGWTGKLLEIPGIPTMYDYELIPQDVPIFKMGSILDETGRVYIPDCDGMFSVSTTAFDGEAMKVHDSWFNSMGHVHYAIGPLTVPKAGEHAVGNEEENVAKDGHVVQFLDQMQAKHGNKSVIYISFGSAFWPINQDKLWAMIDEFLKNGIPLIVAHPGIFGVPASEENLQKLRDSPIAMELEWAPQETILSHPATGWFLSHGGWNGTQEALEYRVPQIFWPFGADQPYNAAQLTRVHKAAFELFNIRTGERGQKIPYVFEAANLPPPTFTLEAFKEEVKDLITKLKNEEGRSVRRNLEALAEKHLQSWNKGGEARKNMEDFLSRFVDTA